VFTNTQSQVKLKTFRIIRHILTLHYLVSVNGVKKITVVNKTSTKEAISDCNTV